MSSNTDTNIEYRELDLTKSEDLEVFLESVEDLYDDALDYEAAAKKDEYRKLSDDDTEGREVFIKFSHKLSLTHSLVSKCRNLIIPQGEIIDDSVVDELQQLYDDMVVLRNRIRSAYEDYEIDSDLLPEVSKEIVSIKITEEPVPMSEDTNSLEDNIFATAERSLKLASEKVFAIKKRTVSLFTELEKEGEILIDLKELDVCEKRIGDLMGRLEDSKNSKEDESVLKNNLSRYVRVGAEIEKNAQYIEDILLTKKGLLNSSETNDLSPILDTSETTNIPESENQVEQEDEDYHIERLTPDIRRKDMSIKSDEESEGNISISVAEKTKTKFDIVSKKESITTIAQQGSMPNETIISMVPSEQLVFSQEDVIKRAPIINELEKSDPINIAVPSKVPSITHAKLVHEQTSLTRNYLNNARYRAFITKHYTSPSAFERMLDTAVTQIESRTIDAIERFFGDTYKSPFAFIQEMSVGEVLNLSARQDVRNELSSREIKYETFVAWIDLIDEMQNVVGVDYQMEFGELFARWIIETEIAYYQIEGVVS